MGVDSAGQQLDQCVVCIRAKPVRPAIGGGPTYRVDTPGEMLHSDLVGPLPETGMGFQYLIMAIDDYCCYAMVSLLRHKSDAVSALQDILVRVGNVKLLYSDQGGEYLGSRMAQMLADRGVQHQTTPSYTPEHNGVAERFNRTVQDMLQSYLMDANLADKYWAEALLMAVHVSNRLPSTTNPMQITWGNFSYPREVGNTSVCFNLYYF